MRLSGLIVTAVLIFPLTLFAQHSSGAGSSSGGSSGGHSGGSSGGASGGSSHASSGSSSHSSPSNHSAVSSHAPSSHASSGVSPSASSHGASSNSNNSADTRGNVPLSRPAAKPTAATQISEKESLAGKAAARTGTTKTTQPEKRGFLSFLRHPFGKPKPKPVNPTLADADLRRPVCKKGPCKTPAPKPEPPRKSTLRPPVCKGKECACPPGEVTGKNGACMPAPANNIGSCGAGEYWNGGGCVASGSQCPPNTYWNGAFCETRLGDCATIEARAAGLANEVRMAKSQMQSACSNDSSGADCGTFKLSYEGAVERYRLLLNGAPGNCRAIVPDPLSL